jgi:hypothetical protein
VGYDKSHNSVSSELQQNGFGSIVASSLPPHWRAGIATRAWNWCDIATYPTII